MSSARYFPRMTEITLAEPVFVLGIDKHEEAGSRVSILYEKIEGADEGGDDVNQKYTDFAEGSSPAAALETLKKRFPREMAVSTAEYFLIGEEAAGENLEKYTDFLARNNTLRLTSSIFIVRGEAAEACRILTETRTLDILRNYGEYSGINAISRSMEFYELLSEMAGGSAFTVPALVFKEHSGEIIVVPSGYAVICGGALAGFLEPDAARGYNLLTNKSVYSTVELADGAAARLENARRQIRFEWNEDDKNLLKGIVIDVSFNTRIIDSAGHDSLFKKEQNRVIYAEIQKVIAASKKLGCDFLGIGELLRMRHPVRWERLQSCWNEIYAGTPVKINISSEVR